MLKHTKIVATISDKRCDVPFIEALYKAGMNVVRLNTAHLDAEGLSRIVNNVRAVSNRIGILIDTKGPEVRTTVTTDGQPIDFKIGDKVQISGNPEAKTSHEHIYVSYRNFVNDLSVGSDILIDDGDLELKLRTIENFDKRIVGPIYNEVRRWNTNVSIAVLPDHPTPVEVRTHVNEPVPFAIWHPHITPDDVINFDEASCVAGGYGLLKPDEFMQVFMDGGE